MSDIGIADEKKPLTEREKDALLKEKKIGGRLYTEKVTVETFVKGMGSVKSLHLKPVSGVWAYRETVDGKLIMWVLGVTSNQQSPKGSFITDASGNVYEVADHEGDFPHRCELKLIKPAPKKQP